MRTNILLCSHDAGGANILLYWALKHPEYNYLALLSGPAVGLYKSSPLVYTSIYNLNDIPHVGYSVISSTGWQTSWEKEAIAYCTKNEIDVTVYFDHWVNYRSRLMLNDQLLIPNRAWVIDQDAESVLRNDVPEIDTIVNIPNAFEETLLKEITNDSGVSNDSILLCLEPIRNTDIDKNLLWGRLVEYLKAHYTKANIIIRPHPSGALDGTNFLNDALNQVFTVVISNQSLVDDLSLSKLVIGYQSSVFSLAHKADKTILSYFPAEKISPLLPHSYINYIPCPAS